MKLTIPVKGDLTSIMGLTIEGNPPMKPVSEYTVIGKSFKNSVIARKWRRKRNWATDVRLPGMLHARMVHPKTLGSTLVSAGEVDKTKFPEFAGDREGQSRRSGCAHRVGSDPGRASRSPAPRSGPTGRACPATPSCYDHLRKTPTGKPRPSRRATRPKATLRRRSPRPAKKLSATYQLPLHEARAHRTDHGRGRRQAGRHRAHLHAQPESAGAARRNRA